MNLVLGAVKGMEMEHVSPFLFSLYQTGFSGKVAFFISQVSDRTRAMLERLDVTLISVDEDSVFTQTPVNSLRYFIYDQYLAGIDASIENILLADVRDIVFQRDPFTFDFEGALCCFLEDKRTTLRTSVINSGWLAAAYDRETLEALGHHAVSCSGATMGPAPVVRNYIRTMVDALQALDTKSPNIMHVIGGVDQAVHNYLLYTGALPQARLLGNDDGPVLTLNDVPPHTIVLNEEGQALNGRGEVAHLVHQYDRHPDLAHTLLSKIEERHAARGGKSVSGG